MFYNLPDIPYGKGGFDGSGGGGEGVTGCHQLDEPRAVLAVIPVGVARREVANEPPPAKGGFASFPMVARLVRYGPVRQKKTFLLANVLPNPHAQNRLLNNDAQFQCGHQPIMPNSWLRTFLYTRNWF